MNMKSWLLAPFYALLYLIPLNLRPLWIPDESRYAEISREMLANGDWIVPRLLGLRYFEKPVAGYWLNNLGQWLFGDSNFGVRFASAACTGLSVLLVYGFTLYLWQQRQKALAAALVYLTSLLVYVIGTYATLDAMVTLWLNAAMVSFYLTVTAVSARQRLVGYALLGLACGLGFLTKGFLALAVPVIAVVPFMIQQKRFLELLRFGLVPILVAAAVSLPWSLAIHARESDYWHYFFWIEHVQRFASDNAQHERPFWFYLPVLLLGLMPWTALAPAALKRLWQDTDSRRPTLYLLAWTVFPLLFFSIAKGKLPTYILPIFAPLAVLIGSGLVELRRAGSRAPFTLNAWANLVFGLLFVIALVVIGFRQGAKAVYAPQESLEYAAAIAIFAGWAFFGLLQLTNPRLRWYLSALCPLPLGLLFWTALPGSLVDSKLPQAFIEAHRTQLAEADTLLSNNVGIAAALAWELKQPNIVLFDNEGEVDYGLAYPEGAGRYVDRESFDGWLARARRTGSVALMLRDEDADYIDALPKPDQRQSRGKFDLLLYHRAPELGGS
ncbi:lipid IV(A) 4-amino-4-deoxy-L-arabinosyltransferase [Marinobacteraceae bacterium S3BR75-40.1]